MLGGCLYDQKRIVDPAAPAVSGQDRSSKTKRAEELAGKSIPDQEADQYHGAVQADGRPGAPGVGVNLLTPSKDEVAARISEYNKKMDRWRERDSQSAVMRMSADDSERMVRCFQELQKVLNGYNRLHEILLQQSSMPKGRGVGAITAKEVYDLLQSDIAFVDGFCGQMVAANDMNGTGWVQHEGEDGLVSMEAAIAQYAANGQNEELVQAWRQIPETTASRLQLGTKILYGKALIALQREEDAVKVFHQIIDQAILPDGSRSELLSVRKILADLFVASGKYKEADAQYLEISKTYREMGRIEEWSILQLSMLKKSDQGSPELKDYSDLLKKYLGFNPVKDGYTVVWQADRFLQKYPYSPVASNVDLIRTSVREQADKWSKSALTGVAGAAELQQAQVESGKTETVSGVTATSESQISAQPIKNADVTAPVETVKNEIVGIDNTQELESSWNEGMVLMEGAQYDHAIEKFKLLLGTDYSGKAEKKIAEASLLAAEAERRKAADIFIRFTKASDLENKKKLLIESRSRLLDILRKYPEVEIKDKIMGNIKRVEKEMDAIDPALLQQSGRIEG
jgi:tetratricopeptide (TPR) repeat protein